MAASGPRPRGYPGPSQAARRAGFMSTETGLGEMRLRLHRAARSAESAGTRSPVPGCQGPCQPSWSPAWGGGHSSQWPCAVAGGEQLRGCQDLPGSWLRGGRGCSAREHGKGHILQTAQPAACELFHSRQGAAGAHLYLTDGETQARWLCGLPGPQSLGPEGACPHHCSSNCPPSPLPTQGRGPAGSEWPGLHFRLRVWEPICGVLVSKWRHRVLPVPGDRGFVLRPAAPPPTT